MTEQQEELVKKCGYAPDHWDVIEENKYYLQIISRRSKRRIVINKKNPPLNPLCRKKKEKK